MRCIWIWGAAAAAQRAPRQNGAVRASRCIRNDGTAAQEGYRTAGTGQVAATPGLVRERGMGMDERPGQGGGE